MTLSLPLEMMGAPGSPYTRKMRALLRYRHIPYRMILNFSAEHARRPQPKVGLLPTFYLPGEDGRETAVTDSTPLLRRFDAELPGRHVRPADPALALLDSLLEDYADEWLTKCMFHYRWAYRADAEKAASILPLWSRIDMDEATHADLARQFSERQIGRLGVVGSNETTAPVIEESYRRFLRLLDACLLEQPFLLGRRPGAGDFACHGQLTCLVGFDPTPSAIALEESPRVCAWVDWMEDLSGLEPAADDWIDRDAIAPRASRAARRGRTCSRAVPAGECGCSRGRRGNGRGDDRRSAMGPEDVSLPGQVLAVAARGARCAHAGRA